VAGRRLERVADLLREVGADVLRRVKDPSLGDDLVSITHVKVSPDLSTARFLISTLAPEERRPEILAALNRADRAAGFIRHEITRQVSLKRIPQVSFAYDPSLEQGARLLSLISEVSRELPEHRSNEQGDSGADDAT
jgi:ribosome-binding factor A